MQVVMRVRKQNLETFKVEHLVIVTTEKAAKQFCDKEVKAQNGEWTSEWIHADSWFWQRYATVYAVRWAYNFETESVLTGKDTEHMDF
jgi:hypothetical protein